MSAKVQPVAEAALGFTVQAALGDTTQGEPGIVMQVHFGRDDPTEQINAGIDKIMGVIERQRAIAEIGRIEKHLRTVGANAEEREANFQKVVDGHKQAVKHLEETAAQVSANDRDEWTNRGRSGAYRPNAQTTNRLAAIKKQANVEQAAIDGLEEEREKALKNIEAAEKELTRLRLIVDGPPLAVAAE